MEPSSKPTTAGEPTQQPTESKPTQQPTTASEPTQEPTYATPTKKPTTGAPVEELDSGKKDEENGSDTKEVDSKHKGTLTYNPTPTSFKKDEDRKLTLKRSASTKTSTTTSNIKKSSNKKSSNEKSSNKKSSTSTKRKLEAATSSSPVQGRRLMALGSLDQTTLFSGAFVVAALLILTFLGFRRMSKVSARSVAAGKRAAVHESA
jgi:hypothetical protein